MAGKWRAGGNTRSVFERPAREWRVGAPAQGILANGYAGKAVWISGAGAPSADVAVAAEGRGLHHFNSLMPDRIKETSTLNLYVPALANMFNH